MLKQEIVQVLQETLSDDSEQTEFFSYIADRIIEVMIPYVADAVARAITQVLDARKGEA